MSNIKEVHNKPCQTIIWSMAAMLRDSVAVVVRTRLAMIIMRKSIHGFPFLSHMSMGLFFDIQLSLFSYLRALLRSFILIDIRLS